MLLTMIDAGRRVRFMKVNAGRGLQSRLAAMGLYPGVEMEVITNNPRGPLIVEVSGSRLILGQGMAHKIVVQ
jgi:ferrous iron transport protein A